MIIAFTGAGISKESGIDTFQDRPGIRDYLVRSYAKSHPEEYREVMREFVNTVRGKEPNDAHISLAEYNIPVITMNVDTLHEQAGTQNIIKLHGKLPTDEQLAYCDRLYNTPVLYEDPAPMYDEGYNWLWLMTKGDIFLVVGASTYTNISYQMREYVRCRGVEVVEIQEKASVNVRKFLEEHKDKIESFEDFKARVDTESWYH